jgi:hypothetical protein
MINSVIEVIKNNFKWKSLATYMIRWQLSTPILAGVAYLYTGTAGDSISSAVVANFIGSLVFYWVDLYTFLSGTLTHQWEVKENITCHDCNAETPRGYRLVVAPKYNRMKHIPHFRCQSCSINKTDQLRSAGLKV